MESLFGGRADNFFNEAKGGDYIIDPANSNALQYRLYLQKLKGTALTRSTEYHNVRHHVMKKLLEQTQRDVFKTFYKLLTVGQDHSGNSIINGITGADAGTWTPVFVPNLPKKEVSTIAMSAVDAVSAILDDVLEKILPEDLISQVTKVNKMTNDANLFKA
jgi:hypothetical protein